jgi:hypothetical protein
VADQVGQQVEALALAEGLGPTFQQGNPLDRLAGPQLPHQAGLADPGVADHADHGAFTPGHPIDQLNQPR